MGRREENKPSIGYVVSLCGIMCGLALALMFILGMVPSFEYISPAVAGILIWVVREQLGVKYGLVSYLAVAILCFLLTMNYEASMMYLFLLGYYPILREYFQKVPTIVLRTITKIALYAVTAVGAYQILIHLFGMTALMEDIGEFGEYGPFILLGMGAFAFLIYDTFLALLKPFYEKLLRPKIQKRMR